MAVTANAAMEASRSLWMDVPPFPAKPLENPITTEVAIIGTGICGTSLAYELTSKGVAGVPRASLVILAGTLASYGLPLEGVTLILGVDELMDMARTMVNVVGNCLATVVIAKWEGEFVEATEQELEVAAARGEI